MPWTFPSLLRRRPWLLPVAGVALLLAVFSQRVGPLAPPALLVAQPQRLTLRPGLVGIGRVEARRTQQLSSVVAARLVSLSADTGDRVQAGQQVGQLDPVDLPERLRAAQAAAQASVLEAQAAEARWRESRAKLAYVRSNAARFERLAGQGAVSDDALLERRQAQATANAASSAALAAAARQGQRQAAATLGALAAQQQSLRLVAPVAGIVSRRLVDPGGTVVPGQPVLEIADPGQFWIDVRFDQRQAAGLALGQPVTVEFRRLQGHQLAGVIERIEPTADSLTEELNAKVRLQPGAPAMLSGGEQQRVAIALALINRPPILLADEPTAPLDGPRAMAVMDLLERLAGQIGTSVIVVTHDEKIMPRFRRIFEVRDGVVIDPQSKPG